MTKEENLTELLTKAHIMIEELPGHATTTGRVTPLRVYAIQNRDGNLKAHDITQLVATLFKHRYNSNKNYFTLNYCGYSNKHAVSIELVSFASRMDVTNLRFVSM